MIILLATAARLIDFTAPYTSQHWIKQLQIAPIARNFALQSPNILWPETDYSADRPSYIEIEFQLVTWLTALLYRAVGIHEWVGRLVTVSFSIGAVLLLYQLVLMHLGRPAATYALVFFSFVPSNWYFSRVLMSEPLMLFFSIGLIYAFCKYLAGPSWSRFVWTGLCGALCFLVKLPTLMLVIPLYYLAHLRYGVRTLKQGRLWLLAAIAVAPALAYYWHAHNNIGSQYFTVGVGLGGGMWLSVEDFLKPANYSLMAMRFVRQHLTAVGVVLLPLGILARRGGKLRLNVFHVWLAATALYLVLVSGGNLRQNYYQLPMIPPAAALIGLGWQQLVQSRRFDPAIRPALLMVFFILCGWGVQPMFEQFTPILQASRSLAQTDPTGKPVIMFPAGYGCLYYFDRPGWVGREGFGKPPGTVAPEDVPSPEYIDARIKRGAAWAVYIKPDDHTAQPVVHKYLRDTFRSVTEDVGYHIFDLSQTRQGRPYVPAPPDGPTRREGSFMLQWSD